MAACEYDYGSQDYWENLYATRYAGKNFDWYQVRQSVPATVPDSTDDPNRTLTSSGRI